MSLSWIEDHKALTGLATGALSAVGGALYKVFRWKRSVDRKLSKHEEAISELTNDAHSAVDEMRAAAARMEESTRACQAQHTKLLEQARRENDVNLKGIHERVDHIYELLAAKGGK